MNNETIQRTTPRRQRQHADYIARVMEGAPVLTKTHQARLAAGVGVSRLVVRTEVDDIHVSTVKLGTHLGLYETVIFGGKWDLHQWRHHTRAEATAVHDQVVEALREGREP